MEVLLTLVVFFFLLLGVVLTLHFPIYLIFFIISKVSRLMSWMEPSLLTWGAYILVVLPTITYAWLLREIVTNKLFIQEWLVVALLLTLFFGILLLFWSSYRDVKRCKAALSAAKLKTSEVS